MSALHRLFPALVLAALATSATAQFDDSMGMPDAGGDTQASLTAETKTIAPGKAFTVALKLVHPSGWHSYYLNSGGIEQTPAITWKLPPGFSAGPIQWPVPEVKDGYAGKSFCYEGSPVFLVDLTAPATLKPGETLTLTANASWQICEEGCKNEQADFTLKLPVAATAEPDPAQAALFKQARALLPKSDAPWTVATHAEGGNFTVHLSPKPGSTPPASPPLDFIPNEKFVTSASGGGSIVRNGDEWVITLKPAVDMITSKPYPPGKALSGIVIGGKHGSPEAFAFVIPETPLTFLPPKPLSLAKFLPILGGMLLGGLILNLMPCVFPVIGLKIMGFVQQAGDRRGKIIAHGLLFALGVIASFGVLSGIIFAVRQAALAAGKDPGTIGWGYQLQNPWVVLVLMLLMFVLALNMFGLFEIGTSATSVGGSLQAKQGLLGSFLSGVLATVVATPCSAPFLGAAIGAAIALPALQFFTAFTAMGVGLALPYLILSAFPKLLEFLPRPGAWMESFKQGMSFLLFATAGYLLWVYVGQIDLEHMLGPVFGLSAIATAAWIYGRWFRPHLSGRVRGTAVTCALALAAGGILLAAPPKPGLVWEPWSQKRVDELLEEGRPVYIDFTAQWCLTCQANKKVAYTEEVVDLMRAKGIVALKADKTKPNPAIEAKLQELGRSAIPVNVLLVPGQDPIITPETLSPGYLKEIFGKLPDPEKKEDK